MNRKDYTQFDHTYDLISSRLDVLGEISCKDIMPLTPYPYNAVSKYFKMILDVMVKLRKATKVSNGKYRITKPNTPQYILNKKAA